jgi:hypothetical protein
MGRDVRVRWDQGRRIKPRRCRKAKRAASPPRGSIRSARSDDAALVPWRFIPAAPGNGHHRDTKNTERVVFNRAVVMLRQQREGVFCFASRSAAAPTPQGNPGAMADRAPFAVVQAAGMGSAG